MQKKYVSIVSIVSFEVARAGKIRKLTKLTKVTMQIFMSGYNPTEKKKDDYLLILSICSNNSSILATMR